MNTLTKEWIYVPDHYCEHREVLGTVGQHPIIVIGVNPSTAEPNNPDNTLKSVERITKFNGYDSFLMFNVYPQRATNPNDMDIDLNEKYHKLNLEVFEYQLKHIKQPIIWCAWGNLIEKRQYLKECLKSLVQIGEKYNANWVCAGAISKKGHPHHPLYLKKDEVLYQFEIDKYLK